MTVRIAVLLLLAGALAACASDPSGPSDPPRQSDPLRQSHAAVGEGEGDGPAAPPANGAEPADTGTRVSIDAQTMGLLHGFVNTPSLVVADQVRIDMSRIPFLAATSFSYSPDAVSRLLLATV